jgi:putative flavoprotein involved in K+ transport
MNAEKLQQEGVTMAGTERRDVVVVGGGQAGLAASYHLRRLEIDHVILDAGSRAGESWRSRWDSLRLFTPARYDGLPGLPFPAPPGSFPSKDEMADYLEAYAERFRLPLRLHARVEGLTAGRGGYLVRTDRGSIEASHVIVATGACQSWRTPALAAELDASIRQLHAGEYRGPAQLENGPVLVVGAGNSGAEIAIELALAGHETCLSGPSTGRVPPVAYAFGGRVFWFAANRILSVRTPVGRRVQPKFMARGGPLIRLTPRDVEAAGVRRAPRVTGVRDGRAVLEDGRIADVRNVVWCTGFGQDFSWIDLPAFDGRPVHDSGVVRSQPGLYFLGLPFLTKLASAFIGGVGADAEHVVRTLAGRLTEHDRTGAVSTDNRCTVVPD